MHRPQPKLFGLLLLGMTTTGFPLPPPQPAPEDPVQMVEVSAERFSFTPSRIRVRAGTRLEITLRSADTAHGFRILGTDINVEIPKRARGVATVTFQPAVGRYTFECARLCGAGHAFMRGEIIVTD